MTDKNYSALDLFAGCGGLSEGMIRNGFSVIAAIERNAIAANVYKLNHPTAEVIKEDIRNVFMPRIESLLQGRKLHLLAGCPPCQGFSSMRRLNRKQAVRDSRNSLISEYTRFIKGLKPLTIMMENVPGLKNYHLFNEAISDIKRMGYQVEWDVVQIANYEVPQKRKRLVVIGSRLGPINIAPPTNIKKTVRQAWEDLESIEKTKDPLHKITAKHNERILDRIKAIPKNGGSLSDAPRKHRLACHDGENIGFNDVYGRLRWDDYSVTITGGCLNPSKGRFLHPEEDRVITPREALLLQTFPKDYKIPVDIQKAELAILIGNALPPKFSEIQVANIAKHLQFHGY